MPSECLVRCDVKWLHDALERVDNIHQEAENVEHRAFADLDEFDDFLSELERGEANAIGMFTFPYPRSGNERKVERAFWFERKGELNMRFVTVHAHFSGDWNEFCRHSSGNDEFNPALRCITQLNVRHAHSTLLRQYHPNRLNPNDKRYKPSMYPEEEYLSQFHHPWQQPVFQEDYGLPLRGARGEPPWEWRQDLELQALNAPTTDSDGFRAVAPRRRRGSKLAKYLVLFEDHRFEAVTYNALPSASESGGGGPSGGGPSALPPPAPAPPGQAGPIELWQRGVVAIGRMRQPNPPHTPTLVGTGFIVDGPLGLIATCAHNLLGAWFDGDAHTTDPSDAGLAIGVAGSGAVPSWCGVADVVRYCPPDQAYSQDPPAHWSFAHQLPRLRPVRLDLAILRLREPFMIDKLSLRALSLGHSADVRDGDPLVMMGFGQTRRDSGFGTGEATSTTTRGVASGTFCTVATGDWLKTDTLILSGHSGGPLLTCSGEVAGWAVKSVNGSLGFARPVDTLIPVLVSALAEVAPKRDTSTDAIRHGDTTRIMPSEAKLDRNEALERCEEARRGAEAARDEAASARDEALAAASAAGEHAADAAAVVPGLQEAIATQSSKVDSAAQQVETLRQQQALQACTTAAIAQSDAIAAASAAAAAAHKAAAAQALQHIALTHAGGTIDLASLPQAMLNIFASQIRSESGLSQPARLGWQRAIDTVQENIEDEAVCGVLTQGGPTALTPQDAPKVLMMVYIDENAPEFDEAAFCKKLAGLLTSQDDLPEISKEQIRVRRKKVTGSLERTAWQASVSMGKQRFVRVKVSDHYLPSFSSSSSETLSEDGGSSSGGGSSQEEAVEEAIRLAVISKCFPGPKKLKEEDVFAVLDLVHGKVPAHSLWLAVSLPAPLALLLFELAKSRCSRLINARMRCVRLLRSESEAAGFANLSEQSEIVAQLDDRRDIEACMATLERAEPTVWAKVRSSVVAAKSHDVAPSARQQVASDAGFEPEIRRVLFAANHYDVLRIAHDATTEQIRAAYKQTAKLVHPNRMQMSGEKLEEQLERAIEKLIEDERRKKRWPDEFKWYEIEKEARDRGVWAKYRDSRDIIRALSKYHPSPEPPITKAASAAQPSLTSATVPGSAVCSAQPFAKVPAPMAPSGESTPHETRQQIPTDMPFEAVDTTIGGVLNVLPGSTAASTSGERLTTPHETGQQIPTDMPFEAVDTTIGGVLNVLPGSTAAFKRVNKAHEVLSSKDKRSQYSSYLESGSLREDAEWAASIIKEARAELSAHQAWLGQKAEQHMPADVIQLHAECEKTRKKALSNLSLLEADIILQHVAKVRELALKDYYAAVRAAAVKALLKVSFCNDPADFEREALPTILSALEDLWSSVRAAVIGGAEGIKAVLAQNTAALIAKLEHSDAGVRSAVLHTLGKLEPTVLAMHAPAIVAKLEDPDADVRTAVLSTLGKLEPTVLATHAPAIVATLENSEDQYVIFKGVDALRKVEPMVLAQHIPALVPLLKSSFCRHHEEAIARMRVDTVVELLAQLDPAVLQPHAATILSNLQDASMYSSRASRKAATKLQQALLLGGKRKLAAEGSELKAKRQKALNKRKWQSAVYLEQDFAKKKIIQDYMRLLGWHGQKAWDAFQNGESIPELWKFSWSQLTPEQQQAATYLGWDDSTWGKAGAEGSS